MQNHRAPPIKLRVLGDAWLFLASARAGKPGLKFSSANRLNQNEPKHVAALLLLHVRVRSPANAQRQCCYCWNRVVCAENADLVRSLNPDLLAPQQIRARLAAEPVPVPVANPSHEPELHIRTVWFLGRQREPRFGGSESVNFIQKPSSGKSRREDLTWARQEKQARAPFCNRRLFRITQTVTRSGSSFVIRLSGRFPGHGLGLGLGRRDSTAEIRITDLQFGCR